MGVADNKSYKDQYHFNDKSFKLNEDSFPSIGGEPNINSTIKKNPYMSNVEIEGREVVLEPDLSALFKAVGKRHSKGGMDVLLKPDSFVFSDDKTLSFDETDHDLFEFKKGGNFKPKTNTPASVLKRNVDPKHYNTLVNNMDDIKKDDLAKKSSMRMLEKYVGMLGNIAYLQEAKKGFPQGIPPFSIGTAPVYDGDLKNNIMENKQYAKYGGKISNPYMEEGGPFDRCPCGKDAKGNCLPCTPEQIAALSSKAKAGTLEDVKNMTKIGSIKNTDYYHSGTDPNRINGKKMSNEDWLNYLAKETPEQKARRKKREASMRVPGTDNFVSITNPLTGGPECDCGMDRLGNCLPCDPKQESAPEVDNIPVPGVITGEDQSSIDPNWRYTPHQKVSQLYKWLNFANIRRYMPMRSQLRPEYADPVLLNEQQAVGNARAAMNTQLSTNKALNPILAQAQNNAISGQYLDKIPEIGLAVQSQNAGIKNQFRQYNNQIRNNALVSNIGADQRYYMESVEGRKNFDNMRTFAANDAMNLRDLHTMQNQQLAYNMLTVNNPSYLMDWRTGKFIANPNRSILGQQGATPQDTWERMMEYAKSLKNSGLDPSVQSALLRGRFFQQAAPFLQQSRTPPPFKKGGKIKRNPYI